MRKSLTEYLLCLNGNCLEAHDTLYYAVKAWSILWMHNRINGHSTNFTIKVINI